jgi:hypothetical protein
MAAIDLDFEWQRDAEGYRLVRAEEAKPAPTNALAALARGELSYSAISFPPSFALQPVPPKPERIVRCGGNLEGYRPLQRYEKLFHQFIKCTSAESLLDFIRKFGPLTQAGLDAGRGEPVTAAIHHAKVMRTILKEHSWMDGASLTRVLRGQPIRLGSIETSLFADPITGDLQMRLTVPDLLTGLWVQLGQSLASGAAMHLCEHCSMPFEVGPGTGRRLDAKFCSDDHRVAFNSLKRSKGRTEHA